MDAIEKLEAKSQALSAECEKLARNAQQIKEELSGIETDIQSAIDSGDYAKVEQLTRSKHELLVRLDTAEAIVKRKNETGFIPREEVLSAWNSERKKCQKNINDKEEQIRQQLTKAAQMAVSLAEEINAAWYLRERFLVLTGDDEPYTYHAGNTDFEEVTVTGNLLNLFIKEPEISKCVAPDDAQKIGKAITSKVNIYYRR